MASNSGHEEEKHPHNETIEITKELKEELHHRIENALSISQKLKEKIPDFSSKGNDDLEELIEDTNDQFSKHEELFKKVKHYISEHKSFHKKDDLDDEEEFIIKFLEKRDEAFEVLARKEEKCLEAINFKANMKKSKHKIKELEYQLNQVQVEFLARLNEAEEARKRDNERYLYIESRIEEIYRDVAKSKAEEAKNTEIILKESNNSIQIALKNFIGEYEGKLNHINDEIKHNQEKTRHEIQAVSHEAKAINESINKDVVKAIEISHRVADDFENKLSSVHREVQAALSEQQATQQILYKKIDTIREENLEFLKSELENTTKSGGNQDQEKIAELESALAKVNKSIEETVTSFNAKLETLKKEVSVSTHTELSKFSKKEEEKVSEAVSKLDKKTADILKPIRQEIDNAKHEVSKLSELRSELDKFHKKEEEKLTDIFTKIKTAKIEAIKQAKQDLDTYKQESASKSSLIQSEFEKIQKKDDDRMASINTKLESTKTELINKARAEVEKTLKSELDKIKKISSKAESNMIDSVKQVRQDCSNLKVECNTKINEFKAEVGKTLKKDEDRLAAITSRIDGSKTEAIEESKMILERSKVEYNVVAGKSKFENFLSSIFVTLVLLSLSKLLGF